MLYRLLKLSAIIAIAAVSTLKAQTIDSLDSRNSRLKINIHAGIEFNDFSKLKSYFNGVRAKFKPIGISMPDQAVYPHSSSFGMSVLFSLKDRMFFGAGFEHAGSKAYSLYREAGGTVDLNSSVTANKFFITGEYILPYKKYFSPVAEMNLGLLSARFESTSRIALDGPVSGRADEKLSGSRNTLLISLFFGARNCIYKNIVLFEKVGYQFSDINNMTGELEYNGQISPQNIYIHFDFRGVMLQLGAEYQL